MSHQLMEALAQPSEHRMSSGDRLVLLWLSYRANEHGEAWPSQEDIGNATMLGERQVRKSLKRLLEAGWLVKRGFRQRGVVLYGLMTPAPTHKGLCRNSSSGGGTAVPGGEALGGSQGGTAVPPGRNSSSAKERRQEDILKTAEPAQPPAALVGPPAAPQKQTAKEPALTIEQRQERSRLFADLRRQKGLPVVSVEALA